MNKNDLNLPERFKFIVSSTFAGGEDWLNTLPQILAECAARWHLTIAPPFAELSYNYAAPATMADGTPIVLKLGVPRDELETEIEALKIYNGRGSCRLLDADIEKGVLLLEQLRPGTMLTAVAKENDEKATRIGAKVMKKLWRPVPEEHSFPTVADWFKGLTRLRTAFDGRTGPFPVRLVEMAESLSEDLLASTTENKLLHGDLHHYNILAAEREPWLTIDPKGICGDPAFEVAAFIHNPLDLSSWPNLEQLISRRFDIFAEHLGIDRQRLVAWSAAFEVLSTWWDYEDLAGADWQMDTRLADIFVKLLA